MLLPADDRSLERGSILTINISELSGGGRIEGPTLVVIEVPRCRSSVGWISANKSELGAIVPRRGLTTCKHDQSKKG
jgi:hypothetical protein